MFQINPMISDKAIKEFQEIWKEEYNEEISDDKAAELAMNLLVFFDHIYQPLRKSWLEKYPDQKDENTNK